MTIKDRQGLVFADGVTAGMSVTGFASIAMLS